MSSSVKVSEYISKHPKFSIQLSQIREVLSQTELEETVKWGAPAYVLDGKIVIGMAAFKNHMGIWFHQGVFLKDTQQKLVNAQEGKTKALRQWRFEENDAIDKKLVLAYVNEAIENCKAGKEVKPVRAKKKVAPPELMEARFNENSAFKKAFDDLTPGKQREYAEYIASAKREATKVSRLEKIEPMVLQGVGLNDKYKNC